ncbi:MAG: Na+/H+ antiporter subunit E [Planctomycetota bacterium]
MGNRGTPLRSILLFMALFGFWLLLSGRFESRFLIVSGVLASALTVWICQRLDLIGAQYQPVRSLPRFLLYLPWLLFQITASSLVVIGKAWSPRVNIAPRLVKVSTDLRHPLAITLLANSITLTPGTVTVDVQDGSLLVHALGPKAAKGVLGKAMERRILQMVPATADPVTREDSR